MGVPEIFKPIGTEAATEVTVPPELETKHVPSGIRRQPLVSSIPLAKVEEAVVEVTDRRLVARPPARVEVAVEVPTKYEAVTLVPKTPSPATESLA